MKEADDRLWSFVDATGLWLAKSLGVPRMTGRVLGWLLVCEPAEQTAAQLAEALQVSSGAISGATTTLVRAKLVDRIRIRGERADRFRLRPNVWDEQLRDEEGTRMARELIAQGLEALEDAAPARRARLQELDDFYAWWEARVPALWDEWQEHKRTLRRAR